MGHNLPFRKRNMEVLDRPLGSCIVAEQMKFCGGSSML